MPGKNLQVFIVADYGRGDLAFAEVHQSISARVPGAVIKEVGVDPFSTTQTGFCAYQLALNDQENSRVGWGPIPKTYLYLNTAPRDDSDKPRKDNEGERLVYAKLTSGLEIVGVFSGYSFSFVKPLIAKLYEIHAPRDGSQFGSRDVFPDPFGRIASGDYSDLRDRIEVSRIPEPQRDRIGYRDGYGNLKLTARRSDIVGIKPSDEVWITIGRKRLRAAYTDGIFGVRNGELNLAPGSSGIKGNRFLEVVKRRGNAWEEFGTPKAEPVVKVEKAGRRVLRTKA